MFKITGMILFLDITEKVKLFKKFPKFKIHFFSIGKKYIKLMKIVVFAQVTTYKNIN